jgi:SAM-dependent methyltransferase
MSEPAFEQDYYERNYPDYQAQNPRRKLRFYARVIEQYAPSGSPRRVHDLGCAFGRFLGSLDSSWEIYGSDVSAHAIELAQTKYPRGTFRRITDDPSPLFEQKFQAVTAFDVIEHIPNLDAVATSVNEQLVNGGVFVFVVPVYDGLSGPIIRKLDHDPTHVHKWPRQQWLDWAAKHFEVVEWRGTLRYLLPGRFYVHLSTRLFRRHTPAILVVCRKRD